MFPEKFYDCPVDSIISQYRNKHKINWLRVSMVYKRHANLKEILLGDLHGKVMAHTKDTATKQLICNCRADTKVDGKCIYNDGDCKKAGVIYKLTCKCCNMFYIGKMQNYLKKRMAGHQLELAAQIRQHWKDYDKRLSVTLPSNASTGNSSGSS